MREDRATKVAVDAYQKFYKVQPGILPPTDVVKMLAKVAHAVQRAEHEHDHHDDRGYVTLDAEGEVIVMREGYELDGAVVFPNGEAAKILLEHRMVSC